MLEFLPAKFESLVKERKALALDGSLEAVGPLAKPIRGRSASTSVSPSTSPRGATTSPRGTTSPRTSPKMSRLNSIKDARASLKLNKNKVAKQEKAKSPRFKNAADQDVVSIDAAPKREKEFVVLLLCPPDFNSPISLVFTESQTYQDVLEKGCELSLQDPTSWYLVDTSRKVEVNPKAHLTECIQLTLKSHFSRESGEQSVTVPGPKLK
jgi:hypothetical protein